MKKQSRYKRYGTNAICQQKAIGGRFLFVVIANIAAIFSASADCFTEKDKSVFTVYQQAPPPRFDGQPHYRYYPVSVAATVQLDKLRATRSTVQVAYWQWANHGPRARDNGLKGNITPGSRGVQIRFSSNKAADACTIAQTSAVLGDNLRQRLSKNGLHLTTERQYADTLDICVLPSTTLAHNTPVVLDYEVQDGRSAERTSEFLLEWAALVHSRGHEAILYPNALDAPSQKLTNLTPVAKLIAQNFDKVHIMLWSHNAPGDIARSFDAQAAAYSAPASKLLIAFELAGTSIKDAATVHGLLSAGKATGVNFWRNNAKQGGSCDTEVNRKISCIAFGRCGLLPVR